MLVSSVTFLLSLFASSVTRMSLTPRVKPSVCKKLVNSLEKEDCSFPEYSPPYNSKNACTKLNWVAPYWFLSRTPEMTKIDLNTVRI